MSFQTHLDNTPFKNVGHHLLADEEVNGPMLGSIASADNNNTDGPFPFAVAVLVLLLLPPGG